VSCRANAEGAQRNNYLLRWLIPFSAPLLDDRSRRSIVSHYVIPAFTIFVAQGRRIPEPTL
jgi:hypothetical protein